MNSCVFCSIVRGEAHAHVVFEHEGAMAFLDHSPLFLGHTLLVPRTHYGTMFDAPAATVGSLFQIAQTIGKAVEQAMGADGLFVAINNGVSQSVPHLHIHLIPRKNGDGLRHFFWPRAHYRDGDHEAEIAEKIRLAIAAAI